MNDVTQQCVSLASGTLSPDLRVDYQFGLVLGVNEFRQEQEYFLEKDYLYNRELHGYGAVSGLKVTAAPPPDNLNDALITVEPGMALDQWGRPVVIRNPQCARLGAWLAKREQQNPGEIASHRGASDDFHLYVVVSYDECEDALVPIPGQPCSSGDALQAPSRIRDSFNIELRWEPPSMPAWDAVRCFAKLMAQVRIAPELALNLSDEDAIIERVRQLNQPCPDDFFSSPPTGSPPDQFFHLPAATARDALDRIFTVWVTEVRPKPELLPNLIDPGTSEAGILLARIDFTYAPDTKAITLLGPSPDNTDDDGRPFLLHTQLIQELLLLGSGGDVQVIHEGEPHLPAIRELVTFNTLVPAPGQGTPHLSLWFHTNDPVKLPNPLQVQHGLPGVGNPPLDFTATTGTGGFSFLWDLTPPKDTVLGDKDFLSFSFDTDTMLVGSDTSSKTLTSVIQEQQLAFVGYDGDRTINTFYEVDVPPDDVLNLPTQPFVTITPTLGPNEPSNFELWFHLNIRPPVANTSVIQKPVFQVFAEIEADTARFINAAIQSSPQRNVFNIALDLVAWRETKFSRYLRFVFPVDNNAVSSPNTQPISLRNYIRTNHIKFDGFNGEDSIIVYVRVPQVVG